MWEAFFVCTSIRFGGFWAEAWCRALANAQPSTGRLGWAVQIGNLLRGLFSYKSPTHQPGKLNTVQLRVTQRRANFSAGYKRDLALDDKSVSSTAVLDQQALPAGHPPPFEKGGRKLYLQKLGAALSLAPNRPPEGWAGMYKTAVCRELFLLQKVPQSARENSLADFPFKRRFQRQSISHAAALDQRLCLWKPQPFEKGWRKLYFAEIGCREVES